MKSSPSEIPCPLRNAALRTPDRIAISGVRRGVDYAELDSMVSAAARRILEAFDPGTRVALYLPSDERYVALILALFRTGAVAVPLSTRLPAGSVARALRKSGSPVLVCEDEKILGKLPQGVRGLTPEEILGSPEKGSHFLSSPEILPLERATTIILTSGSSGGPKAVLHTFGNHYYSALGSGENIELLPGDRWLLSLPLYHVGGLSIIFRCLLSGATIVLPEPDASLESSIEKLSVTHVSLVATQLRRLLRAKLEPGGLKAVLLGGGPTPEPLLEEAFVRGLPVHNSYGLTETTSQATATPPGSKPEVLRTSGRALAHREVAVSEEGEILVRGKTLFAGYVEGEAVERPLDAEGWFHTGDLGEFDASGNLRVLGRSDNLFISGGENVQPEEIEEELERTESVRKAVVVPVPDSEFGERPVAFVEMEDGTPPESLAAALDEILPRYKVPVAFYEWPEEADAGRIKPDRTFFRELALRLRSRAGY